MRVKFASNISRIFYFTYHKRGFVLLHGFNKKTEKTPQRAIERALRYKEDYERRCEDEYYSIPKLIKEGRFDFEDEKIGIVFT